MLVVVRLKLPWSAKCEKLPTLPDWLVEWSWLSLSLPHLGHAHTRAHRSAVCGTHMYSLFEVWLVSAEAFNTQNCSGIGQTGRKAGKRWDDVVHTRAHAWMDVCLCCHSNIRSRVPREKKGERVAMRGRFWHSRVWELLARLCTVYSFWENYSFHFRVIVELKFSEHSLFSYFKASLIVCGILFET